MKLQLACLAIINAVGFLFMLIDKRNARRNLWRIPERVLLGIALCCGGLGIFLGMRVFRHKTRHVEFSLGVPMIMAAEILVGILLTM